MIIKENDMRKRRFLLTILSIIMVVAFAMPIFSVFAEDPVTVPKTLTVDLFNGDSDSVTLGGGATIATDNGVTVVSMTDTTAWPGGQILLKTPKDLSMTKNGWLCLEYKNNDDLKYHWATVGVALNKVTWTSTAALNGNGEDLGAHSAYTVKKFSLSSLTDEQMSEFYGLTLTTSKDQTGANFLIKRLWVEYPNPDAETGDGAIALITADELSLATKAGNCNVTVSGEEITMTPKDGAGKDAFGKFTARLVKLSKKRLTKALYNEGVITFDYKTSDAESMDLRLFNDGNGVAYGEYNFIVIPVEITADGEWHTATVNLVDILGKEVNSTWGSTVDGAIYNTDALSGVGFGFDGGSVTVKNVKANYENKDRTVTGIEVGGELKTDYKAGDTFDASGAIVKIVFSDGFKLDCYGYTYDNSALTMETEKVTFSWVYNGTTYTYDVAVTVTLEYTSIKITENPAKTVYKAGERFVADGMKVVGVKEDETEVELTDYTYYQGMLEEGMTSVTVEYKGLKTAAAITVTGFEYSLSLTERMFAANGNPTYGWTAQVGSKEFVSQEKYDAADESQKAKMIVTPKDDVKGYYVSAEFTSFGYPTRAYEYGIADFSLGELYAEPDYNGTVAVTYRTTGVFTDLNFGLVNLYVSEGYNIGYHCVNISSYIVSDGEWHTLYFDIGLASGNTDGAGWGTLDKELDLNKIAGFAIKSSATANFDIADVSVKWDGDENAAKAVDTTAPEYEYSGEMTINAKEGDAAPTFENEKPYDKNDGYVNLIVQWSDNAVTDGKLNAGTHTVRLYAVDAAGNSTEPYVITVVVEQNTPPTPPKSEKGCGGVIGGSAATLFIGTIALAYTLIKKKREN